MVQYNILLHLVIYYINISIGGLVYATVDRRLTPLSKLSFLAEAKEDPILILIIFFSRSKTIYIFIIKQNLLSSVVKNELTRFSSSILALMIEYIATPAMAIPVPIPVCVDILFPANIN